MLTNAEHVPLPSSEGCGPQDHVQWWSNVRWDAGVEAWGRNYMGRDSMGGSQGASTSHFFSFATAIDERMTSVNQPQCLNPGIKTNRDVLIAAPTSQNPTATSRNQRQHFELNPDILNPAPTPQNQLAAMSWNQPMGMSWTQRQHLETNLDILKPTSSNPTPTCPNSNPTSTRQTQCQYVEHGDTNSVGNSHPTPTPQTQHQHVDHAVLPPPLAAILTLPVSLLRNLGLKEYICKYSIVIFFYFFWHIHFFRLCMRQMKCRYLILHSPYKLT